MIGPGWLLDGLLASALVVLALRILLVRGLFQVVVLFIAFGMLMAMTWVRVSAPDVALAEAGIGAALTGVLLLDALHNLSWEAGESREAPPPLRDRLRRTTRAWSRPVTAAAGIGAFVLLVAVLRHLPEASGGLSPAVAGTMSEAGVEHPVTAVLLNFRSLDTMLELTVILVALVGVLSVRGSRGLGRVALPAPGDAVTIWLLRILLPLMVIVAGYLLWLGSFAAGGAFQAGVILAAIGVFLWLTGRHSIERLPSALWRSLLLLGLVAFLAVGAASWVTGPQLLEYPPGMAGPLILLLELAAALSIGTGLTALFVALHPPGQGPGMLEGGP